MLLFYFINFLIYPFRKEWKQLRNKYLNMQKTKMQTLKNNLYRNRYNRSENQTDNEENSQKDIISKNAVRFEYKPACIVQFIVPESCNDLKKLKVR